MVTIAISQLSFFSPTYKKYQENKVHFKVVIQTIRSTVRLFFPVSDFANKTVAWLQLDEESGINRDASKREHFKRNRKSIIPGISGLNRQTLLIAHLCYEIIRLILSMAP